ncbi:Double-stranded RNA-binding protein Staufen 2 [Liparis tanakae]|uniref:Double-stranded RNA-binding protein Staufen 2 n=1 Tax=Liparis tanakae TaxID=230148 RepID=A0A4Z2JGC4_9TELE|nr:Double-stranded RNA-binding protein Staufen 2 [Liparis tanakae]
MLGIGNTVSPPLSQVQYSDAQSGQDFVTYLTLSPVQMTFHGTGSTLQASHDQSQESAITETSPAPPQHHLSKALVPCFPPQHHLTQHSHCQTHPTPAAPLTQTHPVSARERTE